MNFAPFGRYFPSNHNLRFILLLTNRNYFCPLHVLSLTFCRIDRESDIEGLCQVEEEEDDDEDGGGSGENVLPEGSFLEGLRINIQEVFLFPSPSLGFP